MRFVWVLLLGACFSGCIIKTTRHYYGTDFDPADGNRVLAWPADEGGQFRYTIEDEYNLDRSKIRPWRGGVGNVASVTVVLPTNAPAPVMKGADLLLATVREESANASTHVVYDDEPWIDYRNIDQVCRRLDELRRHALFRRPKVNDPFLLFDDVEGLMKAMLTAAIASMAPDYVVVPQAGGEGFLLATYGSGDFGDGLTVKSVVASAADIAIRLEGPVPERRWRLGTPFEELKSVMVVRTNGTPDARCIALTERLGAIKDVRVLYASLSGEAYAAFAKPEDLRKALCDVPASGWR